MRQRRHGGTARRFLHGTLAGLLGCMLLWGAGFAWFVHDALKAPGRPPMADGIVALTGGQGRIEASLRLLADGRARQLLISGVAPHATIASVAGALQPDLAAGLPPGIWQQVTLGRHATSTIGNADETAQWARANGLHSLIVVTAGYHIRRAIMEIHRTLPDVALTPYAVRPPALRSPLRGSSLRLMATEYDKWLMAGLGLARNMATRGQT
ncbi:YdcF family protein [Gluconacetobacter takamatsuzukensis]|uniref:YdcF family protein n=1 Tax=Gluconacetobacter takamatsuzukensis TaxID=1286190 RepID=A0A7W4KB74_9PROT|nr:YdcF family protein [Gluconacetobacter takamatsuzukensis]MBB2203731.1 YdcF family protein [Gluconacetobacter takamatsuzukensis]